MSSPPPGEEYAGYRAVLADAATQEPSAWTFKSDDTYRAILEHVSQEQGDAYLQLIRDEFGGLWRGDGLRDDLVRMSRFNDSLGKPVVSEFPSLNISCSPTNFRYAYHALLALNHATRIGETAYFIEVGAGYGGLAYYVQELAHFFGQDILSYYTVDVPEAAAIQSAYAIEQKFQIHVVDGSSLMSMANLRFGTEDAPRFLISAYAFSEFSRQIRDWYVRLLVRYCTHGFIVWNLTPLYNFLDGLILHVEQERPLTGQGNFYVTF